ncbi:MAG: hypothetical protein KDI13_04400 [Alphaproteobacteria bacterium]|nr:hypothetical protein [Alphaproteobacteria bacterium]
MSKQKPETILSPDTTVALKELVAMSRSLITFAETETQALVMGDLMRFALTQQDKDKMARRYALASNEFRRRINEFRGCNSALLMQLEGLQKQLKEKTQEANVLVDQVKRRSRANTRATLFTAQEMGQRAAFPQAVNKDEATTKERAAS